MAYPAFANEELPNADAIVVLGGGITGESQYGLGGDFNQAADRLWRAADLYRGGKAPIIVLSGGTSLEGDTGGPIDGAETERPGAY